MNAPCLTCRLELSRLDLADGLRCHQCEPAPRSPGDQRWAATALLLSLIVGGLLWLALLDLGRAVMCGAHDDALSYCPGFTAGER